MHRECKGMHKNDRERKGAHGSAQERGIMSDKVHSECPINAWPSKYLPYDVAVAVAVAAVSVAAVIFFVLLLQRLFE